ncbi:MAG: THUMP domain-containing class I SAM-dependent RNA methyltransferase [Bradymonadia bacterium]
MHSQRLELFAICPPGLERWVADEIREFGFRNIQIEKGGVSFVGHPLSANRSLRCPTRILQRIARFPAPSFQALERGFRNLELDAFGGVDPQATCSKSRLFHSGAVVERVQRWVNTGKTALFVRIHRDRCTVSIDTSGERLHRRGWRVENGPAPIRETLANILLRVAEWAPGEPLCDPMCGSGTFLIEAAHWAAGHQPGRHRRFACEKWVKTIAGAQPRQAIETLICGSDRSLETVELAQRNAERAEVNIDVTQRDAAERLAPTPEGLLICNPPYGKRAKSPKAYAALGTLLRTEFANWRAGVIVTNEHALKALGRPAKTLIEFQNGGIKLRYAVLEPKS